MGVVAVGVNASGGAAALDLDAPVPDAAQVQPGDPVAGVHVRLDYSSFADVYGGDWANRLVVRAVPECALEVPIPADCGEGVTVAATNNAGDDSLSFTTLDPAVVAAGTTDGTDPSSSPANPSSYRASGSFAAATVADSTSPATVYTVSSAPGGYGPTPISPAGEWQVGTGSGEFSYSYPFTVPPAVAGPAPQLQLSYSSAAVDGMTSATNGQSSPAGLGWVFEPGYISRSYASCQDDQNDPTLGDQCWKTKVNGDDRTLVEEMTLSLDGHTGRLIDVRGARDEFRLRDDPGWRIERFKDGDLTDFGTPANADDNHEGFRVTTNDGTQYWFGWGHDGQSSVWTVPVYGNDPGEPCYDNAKPAAERWCQQGWRWNLDKVIDPSGNVIRYSYTTEQNHYGRWGHPIDTAYRVAYDRGGMLAKVQYGFKGSDTPQQVIDITTRDRCVQQLDNGNLSPCPAAKQNPNDWPDVPVDLICNADTANCPVSPSFFTTSRYDRVITQVRKDGSLATVDTYDLEYTMPDPDGNDGDSPRDLWLNKITRIGHTSGSDTGLPPVNFDGVAKNNRIPTGTDTDRYAKFRIGLVHNETGGVVDVEYGHADNRTCDAAYVEPLYRWQSNRECFAVKWSRTSNSQPVYTWFHKYVVTRVILGDASLGLADGYLLTAPVILGQMRVYDYDYRGAPAWRFAPSKNVGTADESWSDWRGYETTIVHTRNVSASGAVLDGDAARTKTVRFRGMDGAPENPSEVEDPSTGLGSTTYIESDQYPADLNVAEIDHPWFEGLTAETSTLRSNGDLIERTFNDYGAILTADDTKLDHKARIRFTHSTVTTTQKYKDDGTLGLVRRHEIDYDVDGDGTDDNVDTGTTANPVATQAIRAGSIQTVHDIGDPDDPTDGGTCTFTDYKTNSDTWIRVPSTITVHDRTCPDRNDVGGGSLEQRQTITYDNDNPLTRGLPTHTVTWTNIYGTKLIRTDTKYDGRGRVIQTTAPSGDGDVVTDIDYNPSDDPATAAANDSLPVTQVKTIQRGVLSNGGDMATTTDYVAGRGTVSRGLDANGAITSLAFDGLGRPVGVWLPGRLQSDKPNSPSISYEYTRFQAWPAVPSRIHTSTLREVTAAGAPVYDDSYTYLDGWGRTVETQVPQPDLDGRIVTVTGYDEQGQVRYQMPSVLNKANAGTGVVNPDPANVSDYTLTNYDEASRPVQVTSQLPNGGTATTTTTYRGDEVIVDPPSVGDTRTVLDAWERAVTVKQRKNDGTVLDSVDYTYTPMGQLATATKNLLTGGSSVWSWDYDMVGRQIKAIDPDTGTTQTTYDDAGNPEMVESFPLGFTTASSRIVTSYDKLNRPTARYDDTPLDGGTPHRALLTTWGYDDPARDNSKGRLTSVTQPIAGMKDINGNVVAGDYVTRFAYTGRGQVKKAIEQYPASLTGEATSGTVTATTDTTYNEADLPDTVTYPTAPGLPAMQLDYDYTTGGRPAAIRVNNYDPATGALTLTKLRAANVVYDDRGRPTEITSGQYTNNALVTGLRRTYDYELETGRLDLTQALITPATATGTADTEYRAEALNYNYNAYGSPTSIVGTINDGGGATDVKSTWCYDYDGINRLTTARTGAGTDTTCPTPASTNTAVTGATYDLAYSYSRDGLSSVTSNLANRSVNYVNDYDVSTNGSGDRPHYTTDLAATGTVNPYQLSNWPAELPPPGAIGRDGQGRITSWRREIPSFTMTSDRGPISGDLNYTYDHLGNVTTIGPPQASTNTSAAHTYAYRADGTRLVRRTVDGSTTSTTFYRGDGVEITRATGAATKSIRTINGPAGTPLATESSNDATTSTASNAQATWTWDFADLQGSLRLTYQHKADGAGPRKRYNYYPFGDPIETGPPATPGEHGYLNKPHDISGGIRLDHRNYDAGFNILTTPDPLLDPSNPQSFNPYAYTGNNPIGFVDPSGLGQTPDGGELAAGTGGDPDAYSNLDDYSDDIDNGTVGMSIMDQSAEDFYTQGGTDEYVAREEIAQEARSEPWQVFNQRMAFACNYSDGVAASFCPEGGPIYVDSNGDLYGLTHIDGLTDGSLDSTKIGAKFLAETAATGFVGRLLLEAGLLAFSAKTAEDWPVLSGIIRDAAKGKGNFGLGSGTASQAERAGQAWVGEDYMIASDGKTLVSSDGLRQWRPPSYKPNLGIWQSNFESRLIPRGQWQSNGHLDITDLP